MPIYKDFDYGTVMGFYPGELEKKLKRRNLRRERVVCRVTRIK